MPSTYVPTRVYMNWVNVVITPNGGQPIGIRSVTDVNIMGGAKLQKFHGDNYRYTRVIATTEEERGISITTGDAATLFRVPTGVPCTVTATLLDPRNLAAPGGGAFTAVLINAVREKNGCGGQNNKFASGTISFSAYADEDEAGNEIDPLTTTYL